eukprot:m51a1_g2778 putative proteasome component region pci domain-containing protein (440) ;mRNA; r:1042894-1044752
MEDDDDMMYEEEDAGADEDEEPSVENAYYNAKGMVEDSVKEAVVLFGKVLELEKQEGPKGEWGFKALKKLCKLNFQLRDYDRVFEHFKALLTYIKSAVSANLSEKGLNSLLDMVAASGELTFVTRMYEAASKALVEAKNQRLWFRVNLRLAQALFDAGEYGRLATVLRELHAWCEERPGVDDPKKGSQLVDVYALEIQLNTAVGQTKALKDMCQRALGIPTAIPHPRVLGVIRECMGRVNMAERQWLAAKQDFFEAFKNYDEAGSPKRMLCLKYLVLASMLDLSTINPFESPETMPYKSDPQMATMVRLHDVFEAGDVKLFEKLLSESGAEVVEEPFMKRFVPDLLRIYRSHVLLRVLKPYQRVRLSSLAAELGITEDVAESLLASLILDARLRGHIDQINRFVVMQSALSSLDSKYTSLSRWTQQLASLGQTIPNKLG